MKILTLPIDKKNLNNEIKDIILFFKNLKIKKIKVYYGWACEIDEPYKDIAINIDDLDNFIKESQKKNIFTLGESDLYISEPKDEFEFLLCHESDIHFETNNTELLNKVKNHWHSKGYLNNNIK